MVNSLLRDHGPNDYWGVITDIVYGLVLGVANLFASFVKFVIDFG